MFELYLVKISLENHFWWGWGWSRVSTSIQIFPSEKTSCLLNLIDTTQFWNTFFYFATKIRLDTIGNNKVAYTFSVLCVVRFHIHVDLGYFVAIPGNNNWNFRKMAKIASSAFFSKWVNWVYINQINFPRTPNFYIPLCEVWFVKLVFIIFDLVVTSYWRSSLIG